MNAKRIGGPRESFFGFPGGFPTSFGKSGDSSPRQRWPLPTRYFESPRDETANLARYEPTVNPSESRRTHRDFTDVQFFPPTSYDDNYPVLERTTNRSHTHRLTTGREHFLGKKVETDPKIIITPVVNEDVDDIEGTFTPRIAMARTSPYSPKKVGLKKQVMRKFQKLDSQKERLETLNVVEDPLKRRVGHATKVRPSRNSTGRLLHIMARQAVSGKNPEVSKVFQTALEKSNKEVLRKARKEFYISKKKRFIKIGRILKKFFLRLFDPWMPDSILVVLWRGIILINILAQLCLSTYILCFLPPEKSNYRNPVFLGDLICDFIFLLEILSRFQIGYYYHGELRIERSDIVRNYLGSTFLIDAFSMLSLLGRAFPGTGWEYMVILTNLRIYKLWSLIAAIEDFIQFSKEMSAILRVVKLSGFICLFAHYCACVLYVLTKIEKADVNWIVGSGLDHKTEVELYVISLYWSVTVMATVGFGDVIPVTELERLVLVSIMIITSIIFGYILSTIGSLIMEASAYSTEARHKIRILTKYMNDKGLNKNVQSKIRKYLEFFLDRENAAKIEGDDIMKMLSPNLQEEIVREVNAKILSDCYVFSSNFRRRFLYIVSRDLCERSFGPEETLCYRNDDRDISIFFVTSGKVDLCYERCATSLQKIKKGEACGLNSFFSGKPSSITVKSVEFTTVFQLQRDKFLERLELFPTEKETYFNMKDSLNVYKNTRSLNLRCYSCGRIEHEVTQCPNLHVVLDPVEVIDRYIEEEKQFRKNFIRKKRARFHTLKVLDQLAEAASQMQAGNQAEVNYSVDSMQSDSEELVSYSSVDEVLDRKIYDPQPLDFVEDTTHMKFLDLAGAYRQQSAGTLIQLPNARRMRQRIGEIETFVRNNYDPYYHNLNLDKVKNFEVYYPNNNIAKLMIEFEKVRLEKIVQMRLGVSAKHISKLLVKSFRMNERKATNMRGVPVQDQQQNNVQGQAHIQNQEIIEPNQKPSPSHNIITGEEMTPTLKKRREKKDHTFKRSDSSSSNPGDIVLYNSRTTSNVKKPSQYKPKSMMINAPESTSSFLNTPVDPKKADSFEMILNRFDNRLAEPELNIIKEHSPDRSELQFHNQSNISVDSPLLFSPSNARSAALGLHRTPRSSVEMAPTTLLVRTPENISYQSLHPQSYGGTLRRLQTGVVSLDVQALDNNREENSVGEEFSQFINEGIDSAKLSRKFPSQLGDNSNFASKRSLRTEVEKDLSSVGEKTMLNKMFKMLLHEKSKSVVVGEKNRAASEGRGKDINQFLEKNNLPALFKKMSTTSDDEQEG